MTAAQTFVPASLYPNAWTPVDDEWCRLTGRYASSAHTTGDPGAQGLASRCQAYLDQRL